MCNCFARGEMIERLLLRRVSPNGTPRTSRDVRLESAKRVIAVFRSFRAHLATYEYLVYIPDMSGDDSKLVSHRQLQAAYEARQRAGVMLCLVPLGPDEINALVRLRWLPSGAEATSRRRPRRVIFSLCCHI